MKKTIERITSTAILSVAFMLCTTSVWAAAPTPVAEWNGDLANNSTKGKYTMSSDSSVVSFTDGKATLRSSSSVVSKGVQISWPDPASDEESFISKKMSVVIQYSDLGILNGNTSLLAALWGANTKEYMIRTSASNGTAGIATDVTSSSSGTQYNPSSNYRAPTKGRLLATFSGDSSCHPGMDLYFSTYNDSTEAYGDYQRVAYWSDKKVNDGTFYGIKVGGTIAGTGAYYRPGMTVEAVQIYDDIVSFDYTSSLSGSSTWSNLVWDKEVLEGFPALLNVNVTEDATLNLDGATITAQSINFNIESGKTLTLEGTATIPAARIFVTGGGKLKLNTSNPGCAITVASGGTMDIAVATVSCAITNNGTINADGCAFNGAVTCNGTINTSGDVSFSGSVQNKFYSGSRLIVVSGTTTCNSSSNQIFSDGYVEISKGATLVNNRDDMLNWSGTVHIHVKGTLTMNQKSTVGANNYIHLYDGALIDGPTTHNGLFFNTGEGDIIAEEGASTITAKIVKSNGTIKIETKAGATLSTVYTPVIATRTGDGLLLKRIVDNTRWGGGDGEVPANYDGFELYSSGTHGSNDNEIFQNSSFAGYLKVTTKDGDFRSFAWVGAGNFTQPVFSGRPTLELAGDMRIYQSDAEKPFTVKNLSGTGNIYNYNDTDNRTFKYIDTLQTKDTTYSGIVKNISSCSNSDPSLTVRGADDASAIYSLTLSGVSDTTAPLTIENNAKVIFSSTGKWSGGTVTVKNGGVLESQNSAVISPNLKVEAGATLVFAEGVQLAATAFDWTEISNDASIKVDLSAIAPSATPVTLIASGVEVTKDKFTVTDAQRTATLSVEDGALKATFSNNWRDGVWGGTPVPDDEATLYISQNSTLSVSEALNLGSVTVVKEGDGNVELTISGAGALTTGGWTIPAGVTVNTPTTMTISGDVSGDGVINVPANTTLAMDGVTCSAKVTVYGTLETSGTTTLSAANTSAAGSLIHIVGGSTTLSSAYRGIAGDITIDSDGELIMSNSWSDGANMWWQHFNPYGNTCVDISGRLNMMGYIWFFGANTTVNLREGAYVTGYGREGASSYGNWAWLGNGNVHAYGNAEINVPINSNSGVRPVFTVEKNKTLTVSCAFTPQNGSYYAGGSITKAGAGTLKLSNVSMTKPIHGSEGTVWLDAAGTKLVHTATGSTFSGVLKLTNTGSTQNNFEPSGASCFTDDARPEFILNSTDTYFNTYYNNKKFYVSNFSGTGNFKANYQTGTLTYTINTKQTKDTEFSGVFNSDGNRASCLEVVGSGSAPVHTLTLSGENTTTNTLSVSDYGKVVFSNTGSWTNGVVKVGASGVLESQHDANVASNLVLEAGSVLAYGNSSETIKASGALTLPASGKVTVDVSNLTIAANASKELLTVGSGMNVNKFSQVGNTETHVLSASGQTLSLVPIAATVTKSTGTVSYATLYEAVMDLYANRAHEPDAYVTLVNASSSDLTTISAEDLASAGIVYDESDGTYGFAAAEISSTKYTTVAKAIAAAASSGDTVTLLRNTSVQNISLAGKSITLDEDGNTFSGSFTGSGTLILGAPLAAADPARWAEGWTGTVWLQNLSDVTIVPANYGNADSVIKFTGVSGQIAAGTICSPAVELEDDGDTKALTLNSYSTTTASTITFNEFRGSGTFATVGGTADAYPRTNFRILKWDDFVGSLDVDRGRAVFGTDTISNDDWRYIYISEDADVTIAAGKSFTANQGLRVYGELTVESNNALSSKAVQGSGTIIYEVAPNNGTTKPSFHATLWTGVVEFQEFAAAGIKLSEYGTSNSKIKINGITRGHLMWEDQNVQAEVVLAGDVNITATSHRNYTYAHISGTGSFSVSNSNTSDADPNRLTITKLDVASGSVGMAVTNNTSTTLNIGTLALPEGASVAPGAKLLKIGGTGSFNVGSVTVGGVTQSELQLAYVANDGVYVACASYGGNGYISVAAAIDAAVADSHTYEDVTILDATATCPAGYYIDTENNNTLAMYQAAIVDKEGTTHYYATAKAAFESGKTDGSTVRLLKDVSLTDRLFVNAGATPAYGGTKNRYATTSANNAITLNLNDHDITTASNIALAGGSLTITGSGTITTTNGGAAPVEIYGKGDLGNKRTLVIDKDVKLVGDTYGLNIFGSNDAQVNEIDVTVSGTITGTLFVLGNLTNTANEINIVVNGTVEATPSTGNDVNVGIALNGNANVTVNGGAEISGDSGIEVRAGRLTVNGGKITATAETYSYKPNGSGSTTKGAAIAIAQHTTTTLAKLTATLNGGTLAGVKEVGITNVNGSMTGVTVQATSSYTKSAEIPAGYKWVETETEGVYTLEKNAGTTFTVY